MGEQTTLFRLKQNKLMRVLAFPVINALRTFRLATYRFGKDAAKIRALKDSHSKERCFIIGNGPSLRAEDLEKLKDEYCFAANRIYEMFEHTTWRPQSYLCVDSYVFRDIARNIEKIKVPMIFLQMENRKYGLKNIDSEVIYINNYYPYLVNRYKRLKVKISQDVSKYFVAGETVTYTAIQLALYMGFQEIYLLGVDHNYSKKMDSRGNLTVDQNIKDYFGYLTSEEYCVQNFETSTNAYKTAKKYCDQKHIVIQNLTRGGRLEVFERGTLETVLGRPEGES